MAAYTAIDDPEAYFQVQLYTGDGAANNAITLGGDTNMQPDFVWIKNRDATDTHCLFDSVRGATKLLTTVGDVLETTDTDTLDSFASDGFQVDADVKVNTDAEKYVAWCWKAGTTGSGTTSGSGTGKAYSYSVNTTSGVSIVTYVANGTAAHTIPHHLGVAPNMVICKSRSENRGWPVQHQGLVDASYSVFFSTTAATSSGTNSWNSTAASSTVTTLGNNANNNKNDDSYIMYAFVGKQGFSKVGSYEGNGDVDGTFVYTGFRPAFVLTKSIDSTSSWHMFDDQREGYNVDNDALVVEATTVEATADQIDLLSNGFKFRIATDPNVAETYIYMAFAKAPFVNSEGVPCNAR